METKRNNATQCGRLKAGPLAGKISPYVEMDYEIGLVVEIGLPLGTGPVLHNYNGKMTFFVSMEIYGLLQKKLLSHNFRI